MRGKIETWLEFFNGEFARLATSSHSFVDAAIGSTADESDDFVAVDDADFALISGIWADSSISGVWDRESVEARNREGRESTRKGGFRLVGNIMNYW